MRLLDSHARSRRSSSRRFPRDRQRGALLGIVLILLGVLIGASVLATITLKSDTGAAGRDRLARQLFDCAEQGLAFGKQYFSITARNPTEWEPYLQARVCGAINANPPGLPCPDPFSPLAPGSIEDGYPGRTAPPFRSTVQVGTQPDGTPINLEYQVAIYDNPEPDNNPFLSADEQIVVYSRCRDPQTQQSRTVQAVLSVPTPLPGDDYTGQAGRGFRNQGNQNF